MIDIRFHTARCVVAVAYLAITGHAAARTVTVTSANFVTAFKAAASGDVLKLVGGFGAVKLSNRSFTRSVTLDATNAQFTSTLTLSNIANLKMTGGTFNIAGGNPFSKGVAVYGGSGIWFDRTTVNGSAGEFGISFAGTSHVEVSGGTFSGLRTAVGLGSVTNGLITHNRITGADSDGIDIADSHTVTASYNGCSGGNPGAGNHPDCIQLWSVVGNPLQSDIIVRNNNASGLTQGFTSFSSGGGGLRLQISNNLVNTSLPQGIACYSCIDSIITNNRVSTLAGAAHRTNINIVDGSNNTVSGNVIQPYTPPGNDAFGGSATDFDEAPEWDLSAVFDGNSVPGVPEAARLGAMTARGVAAVPETSTWVMLIAGFAVVGAARRRSPAVA